MAWEAEDIPDDSHVFMRVHRTAYDFDDGKPLPVAFRDHGGGMSTDWDKYSTAQDSRQRSREPEDNAVISLQVRSVRGIAGLSVVHTPDEEHNNRAHTDVQGDKKRTGVRLQLRQISRVEIPL